MYAALTWWLAPDLLWSWLGCYLLASGMVSLARRTRRHSKRAQR